MNVLPTLTQHTCHIFVIHTTAYFDPWCKSINSYTLYPLPTFAGGLVSDYGQPLNSDQWSQESSPLQSKRCDTLVSHR